VRVTARLISVADGFQLWAKRFDRSRSEVLVVSDEAAHSIAEALNVDAASAMREAPSDASAIDLYLKGRRELSQVWREPTRRAVALFEQAHQRAPGDATLLAAYARARARLWYYDGGIEEGRTVRALAEEALARAPERGESWLAVAAVRLVDQDLENAARMLRQSLDRAPHLAEAHELLGELLLEVGSLEESVARFRTALTLDPELRCGFLMARALAYLGRWDEIDPLLDAAGSDEQARVLRAAARARLSLWSRDPRARAKNIDVPKAAEDELPVRYVEWCLDTIAAGRISNAARQFMQAQFLQAQQAPRFVVLKHQLACELHASVGESDAALFHFAAAVEAGLSDRNWVERCPVLSRLGPEPELEQLRSRTVSRAELVLTALKAG